MKNIKILKMSKMILFAFLLLLTPIIAYADEVNNDMKEQIVETTEDSEKVSGTKLSNDNKEETKTENQVEAVEKTALTATSEPQSDKTDIQNDDNKENKSTTIEQSNEQHKVAVVTTKVDENGNPLKGAVLQILDSEGNVVDEWTSDGKKHTSLLPEGTYVLHEKQAPKGYKLALDKKFTVKIEEEDVKATTDHDDTACVHYPTELYYIESNGVREEVYCVNQGLDEPNNTNYDGVILTKDNVRSLMPDSDPTMSDAELYDKILDIIYHRTQIEDGYLGLTNSEIRLITEYALKNYTSTLYNNGSWARRYAYAEDNPKGYITDVGNGNTIGKLAQHWWDQHYDYIINEAGRKIITERHKLPKKYADYFFYLIKDEDHHPADMHLYIYSTKASSGDETYQNLLSVKWLNPYDEKHTVNLTLVNKKKTESPKKTQKKIKKSSIVTNPQTGDSIMTYVVTFTISLSALAGATTRRKEY